MYRRITKCLSVILLIIILNLQYARADLIVGDFLTPSDNFLITDTTTGQQWLSPTYTVGQNYNSIMGGWGELTTTYGFSLVSRDTLTTFLTSVGIDPYIPSPSDYSTVLEIMNKFGDTYSDGAYQNLIGFTSTIIPPAAGYPNHVSAISLSAYHPLTQGQIGMTGIMDMDGIGWSDPTGAWLSRTVSAPVPEPTTIALLGIGLAGLAGAKVRRRQKKKAVYKS